MKNDKATRRPRPLRPAGSAAMKQKPSANNPKHTLATGLDILEYLVNCQHPATLAAISEDLQVTGTVVNRSISVLEDRGYVIRNGATQSYESTRKLRDLRSALSTSHALLAHARPVMRDLCERISQSCNIALPSGADLQVVAQQESPGAFGISVPTGYRYGIPDSAPGLAFIAFSGQANPARWPDQTSVVVDAQEWSSLRSAVQKTVERGFAQVENALLSDVTDLSCPVYQDGRFVAVLSVPFIQTNGSVSLGWSIATLQVAAERLSQSLRGDSLVA
jgi:DNA-binding IclR family transcriptional regulator